MKEQALKKLHKKSSHHRDKIENKDTCSCFYCCNEFKSTDIKEWTDGKSTAICPRCGIDSVLPGAIKLNVLKEMYEYWFNRGTKYKMINGELTEVGKWAGRKKK